MHTVQNIVLVGCGGFIGSVFRYLTSGWLEVIFKDAWFPIGTATVNITGCFLIGLLGGWADHLQASNPNVRLFLFLGLLGGFTTYSAFGYETVALMRNKEHLLAFLNVSVHLLLGFGAVLVGYSCSRLV